MANTLSLCVLLDSDKFIGPNFNSWYQKLKIVLEHKRIQYVLMDPPPEELAANVSRAARDIYLKWLSICTIVCCIMRAVMNNKFSHKFEDVQSKDMIQILNESFSTSKDMKRYRLSCIVFNTHMQEGASATDHVLYMIE